MIISDKKYLYAIGFHIFLGVAIFFVKDISKLYALIIFLFGFGYVIVNKNKNDEALYICSYVVGSEIIIRMTDGYLFYESAKYFIVLLLIIGLIYKGFSSLPVMYLLFILLLVPGVFYGMYELNYGSNIQKAISFSISGPVCLGISSLYCYRRPFSLNQLLNLLMFLGLPMISLLTYIIIFNPSVRDIVTATESNFQTSGGYGPNQVSTILGLAIFIFFALTLFKSKSTFIISINVLLTFLFAFRGLVTFSRGGIYTGVFMIVLLLCMVYLNSNAMGKSKIVYIMISAFILTLGIWIFASSQTNGLIEKRYANQDARGRVKESRLTGRETLIASEFDMFFKNPIMGVGVGKNQQYRQKETGINAASHNEISRMLAEHGLFGVTCLLILIMVPLLLYFNNKQHMFLFSFFIFWLLTINHAAMRLATPAFVYALSLLRISNRN